MSVIVIARGEPPQTAAEWLAYWWASPVLGWSGPTWGALTVGLVVVVLVVLAAACGSAQRRAQRGPR